MGLPRQVSWFLSSKHLNQQDLLALERFPWALSSTLAALGMQQPRATWGIYSQGPGLDWTGPDQTGPSCTPKTNMHARWPYLEVIKV